MRITRIINFTLWMMVLLFIGCGKESDKTKNQSEVTLDPAHVEKVTPLIVDNLYRSVGTVKSKNVAQISPKVIGYVQEVKVREGDKVKKNDLLVVLKSKELKSRLEGAKNSLSEAKRNLSEAEAANEEAQAQFHLAEITYQRFKDLMDRQSVSRQEFDQAKANYEMAKARLRRAEETIGSLHAKKKQVESSLEEARAFFGYTRVKAPFSGIITQKIVYEGDLAIPGNPLLVLEDNQNYQIEAIVDESNVGKITNGEEVDVVLDALGETKIKGKVSEIIPRIDPASRTFPVKIDLPLQSTIKSGMYGKVYFPIGKRAKILVPKEALIECGELSSIFTINHAGRVERRLVKEGKEYNSKVEILSGLDPGESIVVREVFKFKEGCRVGKKP